MTPLERIVISVALLAAILGLSIAPASATEYCAANLSLHAVGATDDNQPAGLYGFTLNANGPRTVTATLAFETNGGWFTAATPSAAIAPTTKYFVNRDGSSFTMQDWTTPVMYARFPTSVQLINSFVLAANGSSCPPQVRPLRTVPNSNVNAPFKPDPKYPDPTRALPNAGAIVLSPKSAPAPYTMTCAEPFRDGMVTTQVASDYPEEARLHGSRGTAVVTIALSPSGALESASIFHSAGDINLDYAAIEAARKSKYQGAIAYCQAVPARYLFVVTFA